MKKYKLVSVLMIFALMLSLCACGNKEVDVDVNVVTQDAPLKAGLIALHDNNSSYDKNFIDAFVAACESKGIEYLIKTNISESGDAYNAAAELADSGCTFIFADSFGHEDYIVTAAQDFPWVQFSHATGTQAHTLGLPNFHNAFAAIYEGRYLDGVALGLKLKEMMDEDPSIVPQVGYVGAMAYAEVISGYTSFFLGVRSIVPEATMLVTFTGTWYDETLEKEAALALINRGCVVLSSHADSSGVPTACESVGIPFVFYNGSVKEICPNTYIIATRINWQPYFEMAFDCMLNGEEIPVDWTGTISTNSVVMTELNESVAAAGTAEILANLTLDFVDGQLDVFNTSQFTVNGDIVNEYFADVDSDEAYEGDTQVISNGVFLESAFRSAPYFDLKIDGISFMD